MTNFGKKKLSSYHHICVTSDTAFAEWTQKNLGFNWDLNPGPSKLWPDTHATEPLDPWHKSKDQVYIQQHWSEDSANLTFSFTVDLHSLSCGGDPESRGICRASCISLNLSNISQSTSVLNPVTFSGFSGAATVRGRSEQWHWHCTQQINEVRKHCVCILVLLLWYSGSIAGINIQIWCGIKCICTTVWTMQATVTYSETLRVKIPLEYAYTTQFTCSLTNTTSIDKWKESDWKQADNRHISLLVYSMAHSTLCWCSKPHPYLTGNGIISIRTLDLPITKSLQMECFM